MTARAWLFLVATFTACQWNDGRSPSRESAVDAPHGSPADAHAVVPDGASPVDAPDTTTCTLVPQTGCDAATPACDLTAANDGTVACRTVTLPGGSGDHCPHDTDCQIGYTCVHDGVAADEPRCMPFCAHDADCAGVGSRCAIGLVDDHGNALSLDVCSTSCALIEQTGCPSGMGCLDFEDPAGDYTDCAYMGTQANGTICTSPTDCHPGATCVTSGATSKCEAYCVVGAANGCTGTKTCNGFATPLVIGGVEYGSCH